jgi:hypothetical protein
MGEATIRYEDFNGVGLGSNRPKADLCQERYYLPRILHSGHMGGIPTEKPPIDMAMFGPSLLDRRIYSSVIEGSSTDRTDCRHACDQA